MQCTHNGRSRRKSVSLPASRCFVKMCQKTERIIKQTYIQVYYNISGESRSTEAGIHGHSRWSIAAAQPAAGHGDERGCSWLKQADPGLPEQMCRSRRAGAADAKGSPWCLSLFAHCRSPAATSDWCSQASRSRSACALACRGTDPHVGGAPGIGATGRRRPGNPHVGGALPLASGRAPQGWAMHSKNLLRSCIWAIQKSRRDLQHRTGRTRSPPRVSRSLGSADPKGARWSGAVSADCAVRLQTCSLDLVGQGGGGGGVSDG